MSAELFFIYDSHCPWCYATMPLLNEITNAFPEIPLNLWHSARYEGDENISLKMLNDVENNSTVNFPSLYTVNEQEAKNSLMVANFMAWAQKKSPQLALAILTELQEKHFQQGNSLTDIKQLSTIVNKFKLSPPNKIFTAEKLTKDAERIFHEIVELQNIIGTEAIPALLLAVDDNLILLNHNHYLATPSSIVEGIKLELNKNH